MSALTLGSLFSGSGGFELAGSIFGIEPHPASDSALYKMWGNGIALPCAMFVMAGIAKAAGGDESG